MATQKITDYKGTEKKIDCIGCTREAGELDHNDTVYKTKYFDAHQDFEVPIPGFIIVSTRRHIQSVDEFTKEEAYDYIETLMKVRKAQREALGIDVVYFHQEEDTSHHFHTWMFPRFDWMKEKFGVKVESVRPAMQYARQEMKTEENLNNVKNSLQRMKDFLNQ